MKIRTGEIVTAQAVADAANVSRRTVTRKAERAWATVSIAGRTYVFRKLLRSVFGGEFPNPSVEKLGVTTEVGDEIDIASVVRRAEASGLVGCDPATIWRVTRRFGIGIDCHGDTVITKPMIERIRECVGKMRATAEEVSEMKRRAVNARWSRRRDERSGTTDTAGGGSRSRRSRQASQ